MGRELGPPQQSPFGSPSACSSPPEQFPHSSLLPVLGAGTGDPHGRCPRGVHPSLGWGKLMPRGAGGHGDGGGASKSALLPSASRLVASTTPATSCHSAWRWPCPPRPPPWPCRGRSGSSYASPLVSRPFSVPPFTVPPPSARSASCPPRRRELHLLPPRRRLPLGEGAPGPHLRGGSPPAEDGP